MCFLFGDPHVITFDGAAVTFANKDVGYNINRFWMVESYEVKIQGMATGDGSWMQGVAVSGDFMGGDVLIAYRDPDNWGQFRTLWNGKDILTTQGSETHPKEGVDLHRRSGSDYLPDREMMKAIFDVAGREKNFFNSDEQLGKWQAANNVYTFQLPRKVEIVTTLSTLPGDPAAQVLVKMPKQDYQGGWCGDFNGNKNDDGTSKNAGLGPLEKAEDLFEQAGIRMSLMQRAGPVGGNSSEAPSDCVGGAREMAENVCAHVLDVEIRKDCIFDVCATGRVPGAVDGADNAIIIRAIEGASSQQCGCKSK